MWRPLLLRQHAEPQRRRHLIANPGTTETESWNCDGRAFNIALLSGLRMGDRTQPSPERFSTQQTLPPVRTVSRCRRNHFSADGNTRSKSLFYGGEQPWHEQFCQIHRLGQNGSSLVSFDRALHHWRTCPSLFPLDGGTGDHDHADSEIDTAIPDDDDDIASLASCSFESLQPLGFSHIRDGLFPGWRWFFRVTSQMSLSPAALCHPSTLSSKQSSKITRCPCRLLAKCLQWSWKPIGAAFQRTGASALSFCGNLAAAANLPPHGALFSQQLLDLTPRWWTERADTDIDINDIHSLAAAVYIHIKLHSERYPGPAPFQLPDPLQPARSLTDLLTAIAALLARRQPHNAPLLHSAWTVQEVITEECRILESVHYELGTPTPAPWIQILEKRLSLWCQQCQQRFPQSPRSLLSARSL